MDITKNVICTTKIVFFNDFPSSDVVKLFVLLSSSEWTCMCPEQLLAAIFSVPKNCISQRWLRNWLHVPSGWWQFILSIFFENCNLLALASQASRWIYVVKSHAWLSWCLVKGSKSSPDGNNSKHAMQNGQEGAL